MNSIFKQLVATVVFFASLNSANAQSPIDSIQGKYDGVITIWENQHKVPLQVVLNFVEESDPTTNQVVSIIGNFLIDDEAGPYIFSEITLDVDNGKIDMRYTRPNRIRILNTPVHLRLIGHFEQNTGSDVVINGTLLSGFYGPIGEFTLKRTSDETNLTARPKYKGNWSGFANFRLGTAQFKVKIASTNAQTINPEHMELDYTNGKIGSSFVNGTEVPFNYVYIDYLRGKLYLINGTPNITSTVTFESEIDPQSGSLFGTVNSTLQGPNGNFRVNPIP